MFREMRRREKHMDEAEARRVLTEGEYGVLCLAGDYPYGVPVSYACEGNSIYLHCANTGLKLELLAKQDKVCFTVVGKTEVVPMEFSMHYQSVIAFGHAALAEGEEKTQALMLLSQKYYADCMDRAPAEIQKYFDRTAVIRIDIDHLSGKSDLR